MDQLLGPSQVAKLLDVHPATVRRWAVEGKLAAQRIGWGRVFTLADVQAFAEQRRVKRAAAAAVGTAPAPHAVSAETMESE